MSLTSAIQTNAYEKQICDYSPPQRQSGNPFLECAAPDDAQDFREYRRLTHVSFRSPPPSPPASSKSDISGKDIAVALLILGGGYALGGPVGAGLGALILGGKGCYPVEKIGVTEEEENPDQFVPAGAGRDRTKEPDQLHCSAEEEICDNLDNDCDGSSDEGFARSCTSVGSASSACISGILTECNCCDGEDNDNDGLTDADDPDCSNRWCPIETAGAPLPRSRHTVVWTGSEMIVWGGWDMNSTYDAGGRYDPATNSWSPTFTTNAPSPRHWHTAVWTGSEMIVWGGSDGNSFYQDGGCYDPATDSWIATSVAEAPSPRDRHTAVWTGTEMIVWGVYDGHFSFQNGGRYDSTTDSWVATSVADAPSPRQVHTAVWTGSEMIVWGGWRSSNNPPNLDSGGCYDPGADSWSPTSVSDAPAGRRRHTVVWTGSEMIVWGGCAAVSSTCDEESDRMNTSGTYDPVRNLWASTSTPDDLPGRSDHTAVWTGTEMLVWGGDDGTYVYGEGWHYDPVVESWISTPSAGAPTPRHLHTAVWTGTEMIVWGGVADRFLSSGSRYIP